MGGRRKGAAVELAVTGIAGTAWAAIDAADGKMKRGHGNLATEPTVGR